MKILVPTDYSKEALHALNYAMEIAKREDAEIVLLHAFNQPIPVENAEFLEDAIWRLEMQKTKALDAYLKELIYDKDFVLSFRSQPKEELQETSAAGNYEAKYHVVETDQATDKAKLKIVCLCKYGLPETNILKFGESHEVDLVIMGMRGAGQIAQAFVGSTVSNVISECKLPVLALPLHTEIREFPTIALALDLSEIPTVATVKAFRQAARLLHGKVHVLNLYREDDQEDTAINALQVLDREMPDLSYQVHFRDRPKLNQGIVDFIKEQHTDILALIPKHHNFFEVLFQKTLTGYMTEKAIVPILALPLPR